MSSAPPGGVTVRELVETPYLELELLAGEAGLDRKVTWTHISEVEEPGMWLDGGELLLTTGMNVPRRPSEQVALLTSLYENHAAALGLGIRVPKLHPDMLRWADEYRFPVLHVPRQVPFLSISHLVADLNQDQAQRRLATHVRLFDTLRLGCEADQAATLLARLEQISGYRIFLTTATGHRLLADIPEAPPAMVEHIQAMTRDGRQSHALPGGYAVPIPLSRRLAGYLVALERSDAVVAGLGAVRHMATIAALLVSNAYREREQQRRHRSELLAKLLGSSVDPAAVADVLRDAGLGAPGHLVLAKIGASPPVIDEAYHRLCDAELPHLLWSHEDHAYVAIEHDVASLVPLFKDLPARVGLSVPFAPMTHWVVPRLEADWALQRAISTGAPHGTILSYSRADSPIEWLPGDPAALRALGDEILGPIARYDHENNTALLPSLHVYLDENRQMKRAAERLYVHKHTLAYRLRRIEEITGRKLSRVEDLCAIWLAIKAREAVDPASGSLDF